MKVVGLDLGTVRIGVAVSDPGGIIASPHTVFVRSASEKKDHRALAELIGELGAERVVVGLPLSLDGGLGPAAQKIQAEVDRLTEVLGVPVDTWDERFSTVTAERSLREGKVNRRARREKVDKVAAAVILQSWLDGQA